MTDLDKVRIAAHRANMRRYARLLRTHLTDLERSFVLSRMDEEKAALGALLRKDASRGMRPFPDHMPVGRFCSTGVTNGAGSHPARRTEDHSACRVSARAAAPP